MAYTKPSGYFNEADVFPFVRIAFATEVKSLEFTL